MKKPRKIPEGEFRNKARTKRKLIEAVGSSLRDGGYEYVGVNRIAGHAGVNKKLIYRYFDSVENLIDTYFKGIDYYTPAETSKPTKGKTTAPKEKDPASYVIEQIEHLKNSTELQETVLWELWEDRCFLHKTAEDRNRLTETFIASKHLTSKKEKDELKTLISLLIAGGYFLTLYAKNDRENSFLGTDISTDKGFKMVKDVIKKLLGGQY